MSYILIEVSRKQVVCLLENKDEDLIT